MPELLGFPPWESDVDGLADLLIDVVAGGASVSFTRSLDLTAARDWWRRTLASLGPRGLAIVQREGGDIVGCVLLLPAWAPNQPHRAEVAKLLVHRRVRRRGIGRALMAELERRAWSSGFTVLTLDTKRGDGAERLYRSIGWTEAGIIPEFALDPDGRPCDTVIFFKHAWPSEPQLHDLVRRFQACTLLEHEWTHAAHLTVGTWHVGTMGEAQALERLRNGIQQLNVSLGGANTDDAGYHETITRAYVLLIGDFLRRYGLDGNAAAARALLASPFSAKDVLLRFYSPDLLMSVRARRSIVEPDLRPISARAD